MVGNGFYDGNNNPSNSFRNTLNKHGYAFQYAVLSCAENLFNNNKSRWIFEAAEFPVEINGHHTRIDFILRNKDYDRYIIAECKRVNPALSNWCFVRTPFIRRGQGSDAVIVENLLFDNEILTSAIGAPLTWPDNLYQLGFEVRSGKKGDQGGHSGRNAIEEAATQVLKGLNGLTLEFSRRGNKLLQKKDSLSASFIPVIFTTATIWCSNIDMGSANLETGEFSKADLTNLEQKMWVWLEYHMSPGIKHSIGSNSIEHKGLGDILAQDYIRSIAIVSVSGIDDFLCLKWL